RFTFSGLGINEAAQKFKNQTSKFASDSEVANAFANCVSFWTYRGMERYVESGLLDWHLQEFGAEVSILACDNLKGVVYCDDNQAICLKDVEQDGTVMNLDGIYDLLADGQI